MDGLAQFWWVFKVDALSSSHSLGDFNSQCRAILLEALFRSASSNFLLHWQSSSFSLLPTMTAPANQASGSGAAAPAPSAGQLSQVLTLAKDYSAG